jgi:hypothetical protein
MILKLQMWREKWPTERYFPKNGSITRSFAPIYTTDLITSRDNGATINRNGT